MFTAIILACNFQTNVCGTFTHPIPFKEESECRDSLNIGRKVVEERGLVFIDEKCLNWGEGV